MACRMRTMFFLTLAYLMLSANLEWGNIILGAAIAGGVMVLLPESTEDRECRGVLSAVPALFQYAAILGYDLVKSGIQVARIVLNPKLPIRPGVVAVSADCRSDLGRALSAHAMTLTPGQLVMGIDEHGVMYTHCLDVTGAVEGMSKAQKTRERLLHRLFLSPP